MAAAVDFSDLPITLHVLEAQSGMKHLFLPIVLKFHYNF